MRSHTHQWGLNEGRRPGFADIFSGNVAPPTRAEAERDARETPGKHPTEGCRRWGCHWNPTTQRCNRCGFPSPASDFNP